MTDELFNAASALLPDVIDDRRRLHRIPEVGLQLPWTQAAVVDALDGLGLAVTTGREVSSVVAVLEGGKPGRAVLLRSDMDALPVREDTGLPFASEHDGAMHACGHDAHMAMLIGAARLLADRRDTLAGRVVFVFQPGEEGHFGAPAMLEEGLLEVASEPPVAAFALHVFTDQGSGTAATRAGPLMASGDVIHATIRGRGGHGSAPHAARDPVPVAAEIVLALQTFVTRRVDTQDPVVLSITKIEAGTTNNVIPETVELLGTLRTLSEDVRASVKEEVASLIEGLAAAHGLAAEVWWEAGYPVTSNDTDQAAFALETARAVLGPDGATEMPRPVMASEDFSYILQRVPGAMVFLGVRPPGAAPGTAAALHSNRMLLDEDAMAAGVALHVALALGTLRGSGQTL